VPWFSIMPPYIGDVSESLTVTVTPGSMVIVTPEFIVQVSPAAIVASIEIVVSVVNVIDPRIGISGSCSY